MLRFVTAVRLSGYGAAYFFASGAFMSYWPVWLRDRGVEDAEIGTLFMSRQIVSVASTLSDRLAGASHRRHARPASWRWRVAAILLVVGYQFSHGFLAILLVEPGVGLRCGRRPWRSTTACW